MKKTLLLGGKNEGWTTLQEERAFICKGGNVNIVRDFSSSKTFDRGPLLGIVGGLGPETSSKFHLNIIRRFREKFGIQPKIIMIIAPVSEEEEREAINDSPRRLLSVLVSCIENLNKSGADFIVIPCNTVHIFIDELRKISNIPIISIVDETAKEVKRRDISKVAILSTTATINSNLFQKPLIKNHIKVIFPLEDEQKIITTSINSVLSTGKATEKDKSGIKQIIQTLKLRGAEAAILGCTDLQFLVSDTNIPIIDSLEVLTNRSIDLLSLHKRIY